MISEAARPMRVLLTRSREGNLELATKLRAMGCEPLMVDTLEFSPPQDWSDVDRKLRTLGAYDWLLLTSPLGARLFAERARVLEIDPSGVRTKIAVVGAKTAAGLVEMGWSVDFVPSRFLTEALAKELPSAGRALLMRSDVASPTLAKTLRNRGFGVDEVILYRTVRLKVEDAEVVKDADMVIFGSPSAVNGLCSQLQRGVLSALIEREAACIGPVTARAARSRGFTRIIECTTEHTFDSLLQEIGRRNRIA